MTGKLYRSESSFFGAHTAEVKDDEGNKGVGTAWTKEDAMKGAEQDYKDNKLLRYPK